MRCGHRMSGEESERVLGRMRGKYERNPTTTVAEGNARLGRAWKRRDWETRKMYPEIGQTLMEKFIDRRGRGRGALSRWC